MDDSLTQIWFQAINQLVDQRLLGRGHRAFLISSLPQAEVNHTWLIESPTEYAKNLIEHNFNQELRQAIELQVGYPVRFAVSINTEMDTTLEVEATSHHKSEDQVITVSESDREGENKSINTRDIQRSHLKLVSSNDHPEPSENNYPSEQENLTKDRKESFLIPLPSPHESAESNSLAKPNNPAVDTNPLALTDSPAKTPGNNSSTSVFEKTSRRDLAAWPEKESLREGEQAASPSNLEKPAESDPNLRTENENADHLNSKYTFETFVIGPSNRFAHAAATAVAETPAKAYNPLFIYGGSGLGKTHLLHAIGHYAKKLFPQIKVKYVNSEEFTNDFINSVASGRAHSFKRRYRKIDILLIDDIQFLQGKEQTIEEFFHTFNSLHNDEKQIVITSDLPPKKLEGFEERLRSRFESGLLTDVQPPDLETRIAILRNKCRQENVSVNAEVLSYIASRFTINIRELEGALLRVTAFSTLTKQPISEQLAESVLKDIVSGPGDQEITPGLIQAQTASFFSITVDDLSSSSRSRSVTEARQIAMYLCRELTDLSLPQIGKSFGGRDHTTVMHATKKISQLMKSKPDTFDKVTNLTNQIRQAARSKS